MKSPISKIRRLMLEREIHAKNAIINAYTKDNNGPFTLEISKVESEKRKLITKYNNIS